MTVTAESTQNLKTVATTLPWRSLLLVFLVSRICILAGLLLAQNPAVASTVKQLYLFMLNSPDPAGSIYALHAFVYDRQNPLDLFQYWDGFWYLKLAIEGYSYDGSTLHQTVSHYPLFSGLSAAIGAIPVALGFSREPSVLWSGVLLNNLLFFMALACFYGIVQKHSGSRVAWVSVICLALYPGSLFCSLFLSEGVLLVWITGFFYLLETNRTGLAVVASVLASLTRVGGAVLIIPFIQQFWGARFFHRKILVLFGLLLLGIALYPLYLFITFGDPWLYFTMHATYRGGVPPVKLGMLCVFLIPLVPSAWVSRFVLPVLLKLRIPGFIHRFSLPCFVLSTYASVLFILCGPLGSMLHLFNPIPFHEIPGFLALFTATLLFLCYGRYLPVLYKPYTALSLAVLYFAGTFFSGHRYLLTVFPVFWCIALILDRHPRIKPMIYMCFGISLVLFTIVYASQGWIFLF